MVQKKEFMLLFRYEPDNQHQPTAAELSAIHEQWGAFIGKLAIKEKLVSTYQLGFAGKQIDSSYRISDGICVSSKQTIGGNMLVTANSIDEAVLLASDCPILAMGGTVEVRNVVPM